MLIKVAAAGMCRSDYQLIEGYFSSGIPVSFPIIPGHEVAGTVAEVGADVPQSAGLAEGDLVVVDPNWGDGVCRQCHEGKEQLCGGGQLVGFGPPGGLPSTWWCRTATSSQYGTSPIWNRKCWHR